MKVTLLGTGSPAPDPDRRGSGVLVQLGDLRLLFDCGPGVVHRLVENGVNPGSVDAIFFTHHHIDHNGDFYYFAITNWTKGDDQLDIYGPQPTTDQLLSSMYDVYDEDIEYRISAGGSPDTIQNIPTHEIVDETEVKMGQLRVTSFSVDHSIETYGYRIKDDSSGRTAVISGDTSMSPRVIRAAEGADLLIQDCGIGPTSGPPSNPGDSFVWEEYTTGIPDSIKERISQVHCNPEECGEIAAEAGVDRIVLTHFLPYRNGSEMKETVKECFDGEVHIGTDGMTFSI